MALKRIFLGKIMSERLTILSQLCKFSAFSVMFFASHKTLFVTNLVIMQLLFKDQKRKVWQS